MNPQVYISKPSINPEEKVTRALNYYDKRQEYQKKYYDKMKNSRLELDRSNATIQDLENVISQKDNINQHLQFISKQKDINIKQLQDIIKDLQNKIQALEIRNNSLNFYEHLIREFNTRHPQEMTNFVNELKQLQLQPPEFHQQLQQLK